MENSPQNIKNFFIQRVVRKGRPWTAYRLMKEMELPQEAFTAHFDSLRALENSIWEDFFDRTVARLDADETFLSYSVREKWLAFCFTLFEELQQSRQYVVWAVSKEQSLLPVSLSDLLLVGLLPVTQGDWFFARTFRQKTTAWAALTVTEATDTTEFASRPFVTNYYPAAFWWTVQYLIRFWALDHSENFQQTDSATEKTVNLLADLFGHNAIDSGLDLAKFVVQQQKLFKA